MNYAKLNNLFGWLCGLIATIVYVMTTDQFNSWWDTGEFIASAYKLQVVHQPGAPLFLMMQNLFANLALGDVNKIAFWMNVGAAACSGMTIVFLFWTITALAKKILLGNTIQEVPTNRIFQILSAGVVGALAYSFTDTFWYSAVESEVYAMSSLCTAAVFWLVLKWESRADELDANKWLLVIAYVMGLSIGVHLLNLLTIPALALVVYFRKAKQANWQGVLKALGIGVITLAFVLWGVIQYSVKIAAYFDLFFVNSLGLGFNSGVLFFILCLIGLLLFGMMYAIRRSKPILHLSILGLCFVFMGFSSYAMLLIRSQTNISLNNGAPSDAFSFLSYLSREQYGSEPLIKGPVYNSKAIKADPQSYYRKDNEQYSKIAANAKYSYDKEMLFPRLHSEKHTAFYQYYLGLKEGETPNFVDNIRFFWSYQLNHMYARYFLWNFVGRQNDVQGHGSVLAGNWDAGIFSQDLGSDASRNVYYFLPLLLGVIGLLYQIKKQKKDALVVGLLFFFTGIAIVIYLNQTPMQPRERDYAYSGSFYMFAIWIGIGVLAIGSLLQKYMNRKLAVSGTLVLTMIAGPILLITQNWDDHDRSDRSWTRDMAYNYLASCEPNAILFTYADNDTFPLWYLQEVEGVRTDVRIVNLSYLQSDWYWKQAMEDINKAQKAPLNIDYQKVKKGVRDVTYVHEMNIDGFVDVDTLLDIILSDDPNNKVPLSNGELVNILPTKNMQLAIDKDKVIRQKVVPKEWENAIAKVMQWKYNKDYATRAELGIMAILANNNWERPIYFANMLSSDNFMGLDRYLVNEGFVYKLMPIEAGQAQNQMSIVNKDTLYKNITENFRWGNIAAIKHFDSDYRGFVNTYLFGETVNLALDTLVKNEDLQRARLIATLAYDKMPQKIVNTSHAANNLVVVDTLYKTKENTKGDALAERNVKYLEIKLAHFKTVESQLTGFDQHEVELAIDTLDRYQKVIVQSDNRELMARVDALSKKYNL